MELLKNSRWMWCWQQLTKRMLIWNTARLKCVSLSWQSVKIIIWQRWRWRRKDFSIRGLTLKRVKRGKCHAFTGVTVSAARR